ESVVLNSLISGVGTIETNAWRRQQEQFLVKGNIAVNTGGVIAFCVGSLIYDYVWAKVNAACLRDLRGHNWTLAMLGFVEDTSKAIEQGPVPLKLDPERVLFTSYPSFINALINQGDPCTSLFTSGPFAKLN